jgi:hypothetical protein
MCEVGHIYAGVYVRMGMQGKINNWGRSWKGRLHAPAIDGEGPQVGGFVFVTLQNNATLVNHIALVFIKNHHASCIT